MAERVGEAHGVTRGYERAAHVGGGEELLRGQHREGRRGGSGVHAGEDIRFRRVVVVRGVGVVVVVVEGGRVV